jgi:HIV Tat-specific factor 1
VLRKLTFLTSVTRTLSRSSPSLRARTRRLQSATALISTGKFHPTDLGIRTNYFHSKLAEWSDNEEEVKEVFAPKKNKWAKVVIIKHAFTLEELEEDAAAYLDIKDDMREEAELFGEVTNVTLYDKEPQGIITIRFKEFESVEKCRDAWNGRNFAKRKLEVTIAEDRVKFKKSARGEEQDSSDEERLTRATHE